MRWCVAAVINRGATAVAIVAMAAAGGVVLVDQFASERPVPATAEPAASARANQTEVLLPLTGLSAVPVCPGPQTLLAPAGGQPVDPGGPVVVGAVVEGPATAPAPRATLAGQALTAREGTTVAVLTLPRTAAGPVPLQPFRSAAGPPMSAVQLGLARQGDRRGLSALNCATAATRSWLVGGGTQLGRRGLLVLSNPAATPAEADVTVHGPHGPVQAPAGTGVVVPAQGQVGLRVDALAPDLDAIAVLVQTRSGRVSATLHDEYVRGFTPSGVDDVTAAAPPATRQVVPGVSVAPATGMTLPSSASAPGAVAVRVANPGSTEAVARVVLRGGAGEVVPPRGVLTLGAGEVRDVPLVDVPPGVYAAVVEADVPVVAGAVVGRTVPGGQLVGTQAAAGRVTPSAGLGRVTPSAGFGQIVPPAEFGWATSVEPLAGTTLVALPGLSEGGRRTGVSAVLSVAAVDRAGSVEIDELDADGRLLVTGALLVAAGSGADRALSAQAAAIRLRPVPGGGSLVAALVLDVRDATGPMVSVLPVRPGPTSQGARPRVVADARVGLPAWSSGVQSSGVQSSRP